MNLLVFTKPDKPEMAHLEVLIDRVGEQDLFFVCEKRSESMVFWESIGFSWEDEMKTYQQIIELSDEINADMYVYNEVELIDNHSFGGAVKVNVYVATNDGDPQSAVTFIQGGNGGTVEGGGSKWPDETCTITASAPNTGYEFQGWWDALNGGNKVTDNQSYEFVVKDPVTYYARYQKQWYTVTATSSDSSYGSVGGGGRYAYGTTAAITATPSTGYDFTGWSGDASGSSNPLNITVTGDKSVTASFAIKTFSVTAQAMYRDTDGTGDYTAGTTGGSVAGGSQVNYGGSVNLTATPNTGYKLDGWYNSSGGQVSTSATYQVTNVTANAVYTAKFTKLYYTVTYTVGDYIASVSRASERVAHGANAQGSTATVSSNTAQYSYAFTGWFSGDSSVSTSATYAPTNVTADATYEARASRATNQYTVSATVNPEDGGSVSGTGSFDYGSSIQLTANPAAAYNFSSWSGDASGSTNPLAVSVTENKSIVANFAIKTFTVSVSAGYRDTNGTGAYTSGTTGGTASGGGSVNYDGEKVVTATPATGYKFDGWYMALDASQQVSTNASYDIKNITENVSLVALFTKQYFVITTSAGTGITSISPASETVAYGGTSGTFTAAVTDGYENPVFSISDTGTLNDAGDGTCTISNVTTAITLSATATAVAAQTDESGQTE